MFKSYGDQRFMRSYSTRDEEAMRDSGRNMNAALIIACLIAVEFSPQY